MKTAGIPHTSKSSRAQEEQTGLGVALTVIQVIAFFSFVSLCVFHPALLGQDVLGIGVPLSFMTGLAVIVFGIVLTAIYVVIANRSAGE